MRRIFIDCSQNIPCDPCEHSCRFGAITIGKNITDLPKVHPELCTGCGKCVAACPGQACFLIDEEFSSAAATIDFPYEYLPLPYTGAEVIACDNEGDEVCKGVVEKVLVIASNNQTPIVRISVPKKAVYRVRGIRRF